MVNRARPKSSPTDQYARQIALAIANGRSPHLAPPSISIASSLREIFSAFAGAARHMPPVGKDEALAFG